MKRGDITNVDKLLPGDRFYKRSDKKKISYEFIGEESHGKFNVCNSAFMCRNCIPPPKHIIVVKGSTVVVYLRNINQD